MSSVYAFILAGILAVTLSAPALGAPATTLYVAPNGSDAWSGRLAEPNAQGSDGPLASLTGARDAVRRMKNAGPLAGEVRVLLREGVYAVTEPAVFQPGDSGSWQSPIVYAAFPGERPVISGGKRITGWKQEGHLWTVEIPEAKTGKWNFNALWVDGELRTPARFPNEGFYFTAGRAPAMKNPTTGEAIDRSKTAFQYKPGDISRWGNLEDAIVVALHSWDVSYGRIADLDETNHIVTFKSAAAWPFENWGPRQRYFIENVFEALDQPGEWYLNRKTGVLYYWPRKGETIEHTDVVAPVVQQLVRIEGDVQTGRFVEYLRFEGISFQHTSFPIPAEGMPDHQAAYAVSAAIQADGARNCSIENCEVSRISNYAIWFHLGCQHDRIAHNDIHQLGAGGVRIGDGGDPANENAVTNWNAVDNNWIHDGGRIFPAAVGVWIGRSSYNTVSHNDISDLYYTGVSVGWSWGYAPSSANHNIIEYNHIHHIGKWLLSDMGGIYTLGVAPGTILRNNVIHDVHSFAYGGWGVYPDEGSTDLLIENNVVYNTKTGGFHQHYGKENRVQNNIFAFAMEGQVIRSREEEHLSFFFKRNIVYFDQGKLLGSNWNNGDFRMDRNCYWNPNNRDINFAGRSFDDWRAQGRDMHSVIADPLFRNPKKFDFRLRPDSPAVVLGFRPIDVREAGLYGPRSWRMGPKRVKRAPVQAQAEQKPKSIADDFEDTDVGQPARDAITIGETEAARIRVTDETAASGNRSLAFTDAPGLTHAYDPHLVYTPQWDTGTAVATFDARMEPGAVLFHEWRDGDTPYKIGPTITIDANGTLTASGKELMKTPRGEWFRVAIECELGPRTDGTYTLTITPKGKGPERFKRIPFINPQFRVLSWFGFVSNADTRAVMYLDNLKLLTQQRP